MKWLFALGLAVVCACVGPYDVNLEESGDTATASLYELSGVEPEGTTHVLDFEEAEVGDVLPASWRALESGSSAPSAAWSIAQQTGPRGWNRYLRVKNASAGPETCNLLVTERIYPADVTLSLRLRAVGGRQSQGGGLVWSVRGADDYYLARWNPLEGNVAVFAVSGGELTQLGSADIEASTNRWHLLTIRTIGPRIELLFDGGLQVTCEDPTFAAGGSVGLWTRGDARTWFDDLWSSAKE